MNLRIQGILFLLFSCLFFCGCGNPNTVPLGEELCLVYQPLPLVQTLDDVTVVASEPVLNIPENPSQQKWVEYYDQMQQEKQRQEAKKAAVVKRASQNRQTNVAVKPLDPPLAAVEDIDFVTQRVNDLKGSVKKAKNGAIIFLKLESAGDSSSNAISLEDMKRIGRLLDLETVFFAGPVFNDEFLAELKDLKNLTSVTINNSEIGDATLEMLATLPELTTLDLRRNLKLENASLEIIQKMPKIENLFVHYNTFTNSGMAKLRKVPTLKIVDTRGCQDISDNSAKYLATLPELREVYFRGQMTNGAVEHLANAPKLEFVEFQDCNDINAGSVEAFKKCSQLKGLRLFRCKSVDDALIQGISSIMFERLELRDMNLSNAGLDALKNQSSLKTAEFSELGGVDTAGLISLLGSLKNMEGLTFFSIPVDDECVKLIAQNMPQLKELGLRAVAVSDQGLETIASMTSLEVLDLRDNDKLTANALLQLSKLQNLKRLYLKGTGIVAKESKEQLDALKKALPKCNITE